MRDEEEEEKSGEEERGEEEIGEVGEEEESLKSLSWRKMEKKAGDASSSTASSEANAGKCRARADPLSAGDGPCPALLNGRASGAGRVRTEARDGTPAAKGEHPEEERGCEVKRDGVAREGEAEAMVVMLRVAGETSPISSGLTPLAPFSFSLWRGRE